jgi:hypothetical protein
MIRLGEVSKVWEVRVDLLRFFVSSFKSLNCLRSKKKFEVSGLKFHRKERKVFSQIRKLLFVFGLKKS